MSSAAVVVDRLAAAGQTVAIAESLTGGSVLREVVLVPGASVVLRGGVVAYQNDIKSSLLGVCPDHLAQRGPVSGLVAEQMAAGVARVSHADWGLGTTGVAGPGAADGVRAGTAYLGWWHQECSGWLQCCVAGERAEVIAGVSVATLRLFAALLDMTKPSPC